MASKVNKKGAQTENYFFHFSKVLIAHVTILIDLFNIITALFPIISNNIPMETHRQGTHTFAELHSIAV